MRIFSTLRLLHHLMHYHPTSMRAWRDLQWWFEEYVYVRYWNRVRPRIEMYVAMEAHLMPFWFRKTKKSLCPPTRRSLKGGRRK